MKRLSSFMSHRLAWPNVTLLLLLAVNTAFNASFLHLEWRDGHLYGSLIDIVNRAAPLVLVSLGMTLVIATRGIDISVGAVVAAHGVGQGYRNVAAAEDQRTADHLEIDAKQQKYVVEFVERMIDPIVRELEGIQEAATKSTEVARSIRATHDRTLLVAGTLKG